MLSDEEKKAYDNLIMLKYFTKEKEDKQAIDIILNLIEKQSKEIESLKEDNKKKSIVIIEYQDLYEKLKDKIKAKIEELNEKSFKNDINYTEFYYKKEVLQSLLEEE